MTEISNFKIYDLEERTFQFALKCREFVRKIPQTLANHEYAKQLIRSSGSQAANYIEANESLSRKDFLHRIKICRKETKESTLWLKLIKGTEAQKTSQENLLNETIELRKIFSSIILKSNK